MPLMHGYLNSSTAFDGKASLTEKYHANFPRVPSLKAKIPWPTLPAGGRNIIPYTTRLIEADIEPSVGGRHNSCVNALAQTIRGLYENTAVSGRLLCLSGLSKTVST